MIDSVYVLSNNIILMEKHWGIPPPTRTTIDQFKPTSGTVTKIQNPYNKLQPYYLIKNTHHKSEITFIAVINRKD